MWPGMSVMLCLRVTELRQAGGDSLWDRVTHCLCSACSHLSLLSSQLNYYKPVFHLTWEGILCFGVGFFPYSFSSFLYWCLFFLTIPAACGMASLPHNERAGQNIVVLLQYSVSTGSQLNLLYWIHERVYTQIKKKTSSHLSLPHAATLIH